MLLAGCGLQLPGSVPRETPELVPDTVLVQFWNLSPDLAVDVEFFVTSEPAPAIPNDLFLPANRITASIGVAGTGILEPGKEDSIEIPCTQTLTLGTSGGRFLDNDTGEVVGHGTPRWVQEHPLGLCDSVVTVVFTSNENGLVTRLFVGPIVPAAP